MILHLAAHAQFGPQSSGLRTSTEKVTFGIGPACTGSIMAQESSRGRVSPQAANSARCSSLLARIEAYRARSSLSSRAMPGMNCPDRSRFRCNSMSKGACRNSRGRARPFAQGGGHAHGLAVVSAGGHHARRAKRNVRRADDGPARNRFVMFRL